MMIPGLVVGTTSIYPSRFVKLESSRAVVQASGTTDKIIGISGEGARNAPFGSNTTYAGVGGSGEAIVVHGELEMCLLEIGSGGVVPATMPWLTTDSDGKGVAATLDGTQSIGAMCLETAAAGDLKTVIVRTFPLSD